MECSAHLFEDIFISSLQCFNDYLVACTGWEDGAICWDDNNDPSWISIADKHTCEKIRSWCTEKPGWDYCYNERLKIIFSGHKDGILIGWDFNGNKLYEALGAGSVVYSVACHPIQNKILSGSNDLTIREWATTTSSIDLCNEIKDTTSSRWHFGGNWSVSYDHNGERILSAEPQSNALRVYSLGK